MSWEDQGRQGHGWFGTGTSGNLPEAMARPATADDLGRLVAQAAAARLPPRLRTEFEDFTGRDSGRSLLQAMQVWAGASHLPPAAFRRLVVGPGMTQAGATALQAAGRGLANAGHDPAGLAAAGLQLATALTETGRHDLGYAQDKALYANANGLVPDRPAPAPPVVEAQGGKAVPGTSIPVAGASAGTLAAGTAVAGTAMAVPEGTGPFVMTLPTVTLPEALLLALRVGAAAGTFVTILFWSHPAGDLPQNPGLAPPPPAAMHGEGGFTATPRPDTPDTGGFTPTLPLPHVEPGPDVTDAPQPSVVVMARPNVTVKEQRKVVRSKGLPTGGDYPYVLPRGWTPSQPLPRGKNNGYLDSKGREWVKPRGKKQG